MRRLEEITDNAAIDSELRSMQGRSVEVISEDLFKETPSRHRTDTAFKLLDRTGFHPRSDKVGDDNRKFTYISLTPLPGESIQEAQKRIAQIQAGIKQSLSDEAQNAEFTEVVEDVE